ncbi:MAG: flagellar hook capping FlgD N-terminal domain-containing protein [Planctomycetota bacterium]|jgi:flagellar basal-body rod modification protein FlgD
MSQISAFDPTAEALRSTTPNGFCSMKSEDFIRVIFAELANQDPFQPNDSAALLEQLSSIRTIESDLELTDQLNALVLENQLASASNLIGKMVGGLSTTNDRVAGTVVSVIRQGNQVTLELDTGWLMPIESVEQIIEVPPQEP